MEKRITPAELGNLLDQYSQPLTVYASNWTRAGEDCVQEAFVELAALNQRPENLTAWLFKVVRNRAINMYRSAQRRRNHERSAARPDFESHTNPSLRVQASEEQNRLHEHLNTLSPEDREIVVLRIWSELGWEQIAELLEISSSSAHRRYAKILLQMKNKLSEAEQGKQNA